MIFNHVANRLDVHYFETVVEMLKVKLGFIELRRTERAIWLRQPGANVDLQFSRSVVAHRDEDKIRSQVSFLSETPRAELEGLAAWAEARGMKAEVGSYSGPRILFGCSGRLCRFCYRGYETRARRLLVIAESHAPKERGDIGS
jgi:hypothetical protein